ncbi:CGNR zinc finger domain-containing protein [Nocardia brasiliensis]|uniref:CGNR zinc finger domain-containing protein n=1 Tax=Nocardia brasiliensis TaxID=37326 RepID=UPI003D90EA0D
MLATLGPARLGVCAGQNCRGTFVDLSRNGSKQFCTRTCAHRASVAAYRSRRSPR